MSQFQEEIESLINRYSRESASNTPDFILAQYLMACLIAFEQAVNERDKLRGSNEYQVTVNTVLKLE